MNTLDTPVTRLHSLGWILVAGSDARSFLQGQLSADLDALQPGRVALACCNSPQGRVQAVLWMAARTDGVALVLPASMLESTLNRLRKYVLRAKVTFIATGTVGVMVAEAPTDAHALGASSSHVQHDARSLLRLPGHEHRLVLDTLVLGAAAALETEPALESSWRLEDIRAGLPNVYAQTHEAFVAQMLNLDALDGISFDKGCYTGQEIIARTHYRGAIKRRMFRFSAACPPPPPATRILAADQHAGDVVDSVATPTGCELLAVVSLAQVDEPLHLSIDSVALQRAELPYQVPK